LLALRSKAKEKTGGPTGERLSMRAVAFAARRPKFFSNAGRIARWFARMLAKGDRIKSAPIAPLSDWTQYRDLPAPRGPSFRERWRKEHGGD